LAHHGGAYAALLHECLPALRYLAGDEPGTQIALRHTYRPSRPVLGWLRAVAQRARDGVTHSVLDPFSGDPQKNFFTTLETWRPQRCNGQSE